MPNWFKIPTPLGGYNPDWAVLMDKDGVEQFYFVVETKSTHLTKKLRPQEAKKIECGREHFFSIRN